MLIGAAGKVFSGYHLILHWVYKLCAASYYIA